MMKKYTGFTLMELMIAVAIVGILLTVGVPSMKTFLQSNQLIATTNELLSAIHVARSEAIKLNKSVTVCASSNGTSCASSESGNWRKGWIVFADANRDFIGTGVACVNTATDCLLRSHEEVDDPQLSVLGIYADGAEITSFTFTSRGLPRDKNLNAQSGVFSLCSFDASNAVIRSRAVVLSLSGRVRVSDEPSIIKCPASPS